MLCVESRFLITNLTVFTILLSIALGAEAMERLCRGHDLVGAGTNNCISCDRMFMSRTYIYIYIVLLRARIFNQLVSGAAAFCYI